MLLQRFDILERPARLWSRADMGLIMKACVCINNVIVEERRDGFVDGELQ